MQILYEIIKTGLSFISGAGLVLLSQNIQHKKSINIKKKAVRYELEYEIEKIKSEIVNVARVVTDIAINKKLASDIRLHVPAQRSIIFLEKNIEEIYLSAKCNSRKRIKPIIFFFSNLESIRNKMDEESIKYIKGKMSYYDGGMDYAELNLRYIRYACGAAINIRAYIDNEDLDTGGEAGSKYTISFCKEINVDYEEMNKFFV